MTANPGIQILMQSLPAGSFKLMGAQKFAGVDGQSRGIYHTDWTQIQPRIGFAYRLGPNTVIRGGGGRFSQASFDTGGQNGFSRSTAFNQSSDNYLTPSDTLDNPYRNGILNPTGATMGPLTNLGQGVGSGATGSWNYQDPRRFYSWEYSFHLQKQVKSWLLEVGYSHNKSHRRRLVRHAASQRLRQAAMQQLRQVAATTRRYAPRSTRPCCGCSTRCA